MQLPESQDAFLLGKLIEVNRSQSGWKDFMQTLLEHFNLRSFHLYVVNNHTQAMRFHVDAGETVNAEYMAIYVDKYVHDDRLMKAVNSLPIGQFYASNLLDAQWDVYGNEYFKKWAIPQGIAEGAVARVFEEGEWTCYMASNRNAEQGPYSAAEVERINALLPYVEIAVRASFAVEDNNQAERRARAIINTYKIPIALFTEYGELWLLNEPMEYFIQQQSSVAVHNKQLKIADKLKDKYLNLALLDSIKRTDGIDMDLSNAKQIALDEDNVLAFQPLLDSDGEQESFLGVMMFVLQKQRSSQLHSSQLHTLFKLTPAESEVCLQLMAGLNIKEIASQQGISVHTIREHLSKALHKTGCSTQVSLISLLSDIPRAGH